MPKKTTVTIITPRGLHTLPKTFLSARLALFLILGMTIVGIGGFMILENYTLLEGIYMTVITLSTVGYTEVRPLSSSGQLFASILIIFNTGIFAYMLAVFSYYVISGEYFKRIHLNMINKNIEKLKDHVIICGYGRYGVEVTSHFQHHDMPFVVVERDAQVVEDIRRSKESILYVEDDATRDEALQAAGIKSANALIAALPDDSENLFIVLTARQLNPELSIISRASNVRSKKKLELAGANHVVMPDQIGGFYMATLVSKPGATEFFSYITREIESDIEFEEISFSDLPQSCRGLAIRDLKIREETGTNIIAYKAPEGQYEVNPGPETVMEKNSSFIVIGNQQQLKALKRFLQSRK